MSLKKTKRKQLNEIQDKELKENKCLSVVQAIIMLMGMTKQAKT